MRIKEIMKEKGMTQAQLAEEMGVSLQSVKQTLNAPSVTTATLERIATALNVPMWQLFASAEEATQQNEGNTIVCPHCGKRIILEPKKAQ